MEIGFIGLGKLGKDCAEVMAEKHNVTGYDITDVSSRSVQMVNYIEKTVVGKDFTFIAVPTPHAEKYDGRYPTSHLEAKDFDYSTVIKVLKRIKDIESDATIVLISTVLPGTIRRILLPHIDPKRFIYNPYLIAMGTVKYDMKNPEMIIVGREGISTERLKKLYTFYLSFCENNPRFEVGTWDEAECIKIFYNTFISMKIGFVNTILDIAEKNGNINVDVVINALIKSGKRIISDKFMKAGMGDGGACHPRDNIALSSLSERLGLNYDFFGSLMFIREKQAENLADKLISYGNPIVILGKSYKPDVDYIDGSYSVLIGNYIVQKSELPLYYDSEPSTRKLTYLVGHKGKFINYDFKKGSVIVDPWGQCDNKDCEVVYYGRTK